MHILGGMVIIVLHQIFDRMQAVREDKFVSRTQRNAMVEWNERIALAKADCAKAPKEYDTLKAEITKEVMGQSA
jgi:hypothetical protein